MPTFEEMYIDSAIGAFDKQLRLMDVHGGHAWGFHMERAELTFERPELPVSYEIQIMGTESHMDNTWLWGWANDASGIPNAMLELATKLRTHGNEQAISELTTPCLPLGEVDGHKVGMIGSAFCKAQAYYRCPYEGGALFVLIVDPNLRLDVEDIGTRVTTIVPQAISQLELVDHARAIGSYLNQLGFQVDQSDGRLTATLDKWRVEASFDELHRLAQLQLS